MRERENDVRTRMYVSATFYNANERVNKLYFFCEMFSQ